MKKRITAYVESICESGFACLITMVQGDVFSLSLSHWVLASETGVVAGALVIVHRANFGVASFLEALATGVGAFALSLATTSLMRAMAAARARRRAARMERGA
jgi:hypothetical protein